MTTRTLNRSLLATMVGAALALGTAAASPAQAAPGHDQHELHGKGKAKQDDERAERADHATVDAKGKARVQHDERVRADVDARAQAQLRAERQQVATRAQMDARIQAARAERDQARALAERRERERQANSPRPSDRALERSPTHREIAPRAGVPYGQVVSAERHRRNAERAAERDGNRNRDWRLDDRARREAIAREQARQSQYRDFLAQRQRLAYQRSIDLQRMNRLAQYRYQQQYYERLRQMRLRDSSYDWYRDPFFNSAPTYGYYRTGNYYQVNNYAADLLRQAVRLGYQEGYQAGRADMQDGWRPDYRNSFAYQDANYGYRGYYVDRGEYNYYFRQGFQRGYQDGYDRSNRYGRYSNGNASILETVLALVLNLRGL
jgi:hypothetical protein